jgi:hypothetical protein
MILRLNIAILSDKEANILDIDFSSRRKTKISGSIKHNTSFIILIILNQIMDFS